MWRLWVVVVGDEPNPDVVGIAGLTSASPSLVVTLVNRNSQQALSRPLQLLGFGAAKLPAFASVTLLTAQGLDADSAFDLSTTEVPVDHSSGVLLAAIPAYSIWQARIDLS